uniref:Uncharacterized protein n=1 Tax=Avena sativa TaxID=4498 RepID=A0ACD5ZJZ2_AVESA
MGAAAGEEGEAAVRVLVVDDSPVDRKVVELLLRSHRAGAAAFHVTTVDSGKKAMELLLLGLDDAHGKQQRRSVDMVLTDYCMPEMTGYDLLRAIKVRAPWFQFPSIIIISQAYASSDPLFLCDDKIFEHRQALGSANPIPVVVMSSENEPQRISRFASFLPRSVLAQKKFCAKEEESCFRSLHIYSTALHVSRPPFSEEEKGNFTH